jgi:hypothetical protein
MSASTDADRARGVARFIEHLRPAQPRRTRPRRLRRCRGCRSEAVAQIVWDVDERMRWQVWLCCGNCGAWREARITHTDAVDYRERLATQRREIERELDRLDRERMVEQAEAFITALHHDIVPPADFAS